MNEFYYPLIKYLFYRWILLNQKEYEKHDVKTLIKEDVDSYVIFFESEDKFGRIIIWFADVVELELFNKETGEKCFYLHFEIANIGQCVYLFRQFYYCLTKQITGRRYRVLVCCTGGLTSSLFSSRLQELVSIKRYNIQLEASAYCYLEEQYEDYDLILLAPQLSHYAPKIQYQIKNKIPVKNINPMEYATLSLDYTFDLICEFAARAWLLH